MAEGLPFPVPESRKDEESFHDRIARLRRIQKEAAARVARRYADVKPEKGKWRVGDKTDFKLDPPQVL